MKDICNEGIPVSYSKTFEMHKIKWYADSLTTVWPWPLNIVFEVPAKILMCIVRMFCDWLASDLPHRYDNSSSNYKQSGTRFL